MTRRYRKNLPSNSTALWTIQDAGAPDRLRRDAHLRADGRYVPPDYRPAYRWLVGELIARIGPPPRGVRYPIWAWTERPDLCQNAHAPAGRPSVLLHLEVAADRVALTDFLRWHAVLNNHYLTRSEAEWETTERAPETDVRTSWQRIFDLDDSRDLAWEGEPVAQACLWEVRPDDVRRVEQFIAR